ncbi:MAG: hypothetical protein KAJ18_02530 [Candidatus Omnitrophica bacterium]|nr:hypothetical protein [Candidatus Omnitrophota bacterium]
MKRFFLILAIFLLSLNYAEAKLVRYIDEQGKTHFVNTDYARIPEKYYYQVRDQLEEPIIPEENVDLEETEKMTEDEEESTWEEEEPTGEEDTSAILEEYTVPLEYEDEAGQKKHEGKSQSQRIEVFVSSDCADCHKLETSLRVSSINYLRYDVDNNNYGRTVYEELGGDLPITRINSTIVRGCNLRKILAIIKALKKR